MGTPWEQLVVELRAFDDRRTIVQALRKGLRATLPEARTAIRAAAVDMLPSSGGLGKWVARAPINIKVRASGRSASIRLTGGRNSEGGRSDLSAIDRGRVRAPSWGRRGRGQWHTVLVPAGYFRGTAAALDGWRRNVDAEVDRSLDTLRRG